ncbi:MAG: choice-of-anchor Q domain-containing protein [Candidatus Sulfotelmatobacter sp.]
MKKSICKFILHLRRAQLGSASIVASTMILFGCGISTGPSTNTSSGSNPGTPTNPTPTFTNYYVSNSGSDSNDGSQSSPWLTIQNAAIHIGPGSVVHVAPGTYAEAIDIKINGTQSAPVTFLSDVQWGAKVIGTSTSNYTFYVEGDYINIDGFDITNINSTSGHVGVMAVGNYDQVIGNDIHDIDPMGGSDNLGGAGILLGTATTCCSNAMENIVHDIGNLTVSWASTHGIYAEEPYGTIANNITYRNQGYGIQLWHNASHIVVVNNTIFNNGMGGIVLGATFTAPDAIDDYNVVMNNIVVYNGTNTNADYGILEDGWTGAHNQYLNNLVYGNVPGNISLLNGLQATNTVVAPPQFVNYLANGGGNYQLQSTSPAIDAGSDYQGYGPAIDYEGGPRPIGPAWDIGAYEYNSPPASWPSTNFP